MPFPDLRHVALTALLAGSITAAAAPEAARNDIAARLQATLPGVRATDYALGSAAFDDALRAKIEENAAAGDAVVQAGKAIWERRFKNGRSLGGCFPNGGRRVAGAYPLYDPRAKRVVTLEIAINQCLRGHGEPLMELESPQMATVTAYLRSLSNGQKVAVRVPIAANERFDQGQRLYVTRMGQRNYACASCHVQVAGKRYEDTPLSPAIGQATHWPVIRDGAALTMQMRMRECLELMGAAPFPAGSEELNHLEYFLTYLSNGLPLKANAWRPKAP
ncbi:MAG TPA: sulfur oxidation c-type cytochrome SoxA [Usitatibacter sp.]|nr:sulfur oxidation c-type cytochrome SoxA [Usitatibacter sp.]